MIRYKCIMDYPGGPGKGSIVYSPHKVKSYDEPFKLKNDRNTINYIFFTEEEIKNYSKIWKKI